MRSVFHNARAPRGRSVPSAQAPLFVGVVFSFLLFLALPYGAISAGIHADTVTDHTNVVRVAAGLRPLWTDAALTAAAQRRAEELVRSSTFDHVRPDGAPFSTAVVETGYPFDRVAENLAIDYLNEAPMIAAWLRSASHRRNLLGDGYAHIGVGVASGTVDGIPTIVVVQLAGSLRDPASRGWKRLPAALPMG
ncbi:MAG: CAP domain-containing protein [bacterium]|nr:CAP domain-containing protein [bacterium]